MALWNQKPVEPDSKWPELYREESRKVLMAAPNLITEIHHIGSTTVANLLAKPVIDLMAVTEDLNAVHLSAKFIESLGYEYKGEFGIAERAYFCRQASPNAIAAHLHVFHKDHYQWVCLCFDHVQNETDHIPLSTRTSALLTCLHRFYTMFRSDYKFKYSASIMIKVDREIGQWVLAQ